MRLIIAIGVSAGMTILTMAIINRIAATRRLVATDPTATRNGA